MVNLDETHTGTSELLQRGKIGVVRSFIPGNRCAIDKTVEETSMKHSKSRSDSGGSGSSNTGIAGNNDAYLHWRRTTYELSKQCSRILSRHYQTFGLVQS